MELISYINGLLLIRSGITKVLLDIMSGSFGYFFCSEKGNFLFDNIIGGYKNGR